MKCTKCDVELDIEDWYSRKYETCRPCREIIKAFKDINGIEIEQKRMEIMTDDELFYKYGLEF